MVSMLLNWLWPADSRNGNELEEINAKLATLLKELDEPASSFEETRADKSVKSACTRRDGVITALNRTGGVINRKYEFENVDVGDQWEDLKVGKKVTVS